MTAWDESVSRDWPYRLMNALTGRGAVGGPSGSTPATPAAIRKDAASPRPVSASRSAA